MCNFFLVFFSPFSIAITSLGEERANLSAFRTFVRFVLVWIRRCPLPLGVWEGMRFVIVALPGLFSYLFFPNGESRIRIPPRFFLFSYFSFRARFLKMPRVSWIGLVLYKWSWSTMCMLFPNACHFNNHKWKVLHLCWCMNITKTCLYNFDPLKPHFYIVKLGFTGVDIIFLISAQNIDCGYS